MSSTSQPPNMTKISSKGRFENMEPDDNDVPQSLLLEANDNPTASPIDDNHMKFHEDTISRNSAGIRQRQMDHGDTSVPASTPYRSSQLPFSPSISKVDAARWRWVNVSNLDNFMRDVYDYFEGGGFWCILCANALWLLETLFVTVLLSFLTQCVDYSKVPKSKALHQVVIDQCTRNMSFKWSIGIWIYSFFFIWKSVQYFFEIRRLIHIRDFYRYLLDIPEQDMQTVSWQDVVARIMLLRDHNPRTATNTSPHLRKFLGSQSKERLDAHDIANRLMRRENYLIAMINKDVLNLSLPVPFLRNRQLFSKTMEWYLHYSILDMVFNERGEVRQEFLRADKRRTLSQKLRQRLIFAGVLNLLLAPIVLAYVVIVYFFTYYNVCSFGSFGLAALIYSEVANVVMQEYQKDPKLAAARKYTALAEWKFREFNELPHIFHERLHMSYPFATRYIDQFPKRLTEDVARSIAFVSGALAAVLAVCTVLDSELFLGFEITKDRTVLFYLGVFGAIWAITRGMISEEATVFNPEYALRNVIEYTHFMPDHWEGRLHSFEVKQEFADFYKMKVVIFMEEVMGIITTPMLLLFSLPSCCEQVVDFFREFTVHVDGLGYVCSFALFDFSRGVGAAQQKSTNADVREDYYSTKHGKMAASYYGFLDNYVVNPKTGIPGHLPPGSRHAFHPPPSFPSLNSPTLPTDVPTSIPGKMDDKLDGFAGKMHTIGTLSLMQSSSLLLDGRNIPSSAGRSLPRTRLFKPGQRLGASHIGRTINENSSGSDMKFDEDDAAEVEAALGESTWQTSPGKGVSREPSALSVDAADGGVLGLIQQFRQAQHGRRTGSIV